MPQCQRFSSLSTLFISYEVKADDNDCYMTGWTYSHQSIIWCWSRGEL